MRIIYNFSIILYDWAIKIAALFDKKARSWVEGRKGLLDQIALSIDHDAENIWFHCASLGEFEQGRPLIEKFRAENPDTKIVLTFFSPSGYEIRKNYPGADYVFYLPLDLPGHVARFIEYVQPRMAVFVKYEYWFNYLELLNRNNIPIIFISAIFRPGQMFFSWWGGWFRNHLKKVTWFFVQDKQSRNLLESIGIRNVATSGDTRFDRVREISLNPARFEKVEKFIQGSVIFLAGSTWPADEQLLATLINEEPRDIKYILVPHEIDPGHITKLSTLIKKNLAVYSRYDEQNFMNAQVLIIDRIGMLSSLYQYATIAYIGGGFGKGIHNILEAATFGMPVIFGPNYTKFAEAVELVNYKSAFTVKNGQELKEIASKLMGDYKLLKNMSDVSRDYVISKCGATSQILHFINAILYPAGNRNLPFENMNMN